MNLPKVFSAFVLVAVVGFAQQTLASIAVSSSDFTGSRATVGTSGTGGGLIWNPAAGAWSGGKFSISWAITQNASDFTYEYTLKTPGALGGTGAQLSHWLLELSPTDASGGSLDAYWVDVFNTPGTLGNYTDEGIADVPASDIGDGADSGNSNQGIPGALYGVKFTRGSDVNTTKVTFTSPQVPIWGDFYARDGGGNGANTIYAYNIGFGTDPAADATVFTNWIPRPDGVSIPPNPEPNDVVPEASSVFVWIALSCVGAIGWGRTRRRHAE
ncbi:MAG: hypothetical protein KDA44_11405 [Planctomycetales bacterium]|nr:hypothetical protein [Planctomycetales bacterium]